MSEAFVAFVRFEEKLLMLKRSNTAADLVHMLLKLAKWRTAHQVQNGTHSFAPVRVEAFYLELTGSG